MMNDEKSMTTMTTKMIIKMMMTINTSNWLKFYRVIHTVCDFFLDDISVLITTGGFFETT